jgi:hypothetical protein
VIGQAFEASSIVGACDYEVLDVKGIVLLQEQKGIKQM